MLPACNAPMPCRIAICSLSGSTECYQHAMRLYRVVLPSVACPALQNVSALSLKWHDFRKKFIEHQMCASFTLKRLSVTFLILSTFESDIVIRECR